MATTPQTLQVYVVAEDFATARAKAREGDFERQYWQADADVKFRQDKGDPVRVFTVVVTIAINSIREN